VDERERSPHEEGRTGPQGAHGLAQTGKNAPCGCVPWFECIPYKNSHVRKLIPKATWGWYLEVGPLEAP
jgi:hypothetical protein